MAAPVHLVRAAIRAERAYRVPTTVEAAAKLDQNESPFDLPRAMKDAAMAFLDVEWNRYPDDQPVRLVAALEAAWGLPEGSVLVGRGSNDLVQTLGLCFLERGTPVVLPAPMFALYGSVARMHAADVVGVPPEADLSHDPDRVLAAAVEARAPVTVVTTPNNPTGAIFTHEGLRRLAAGVPGLLVVDEAYFEFLDGPSGLDLLREFDNVIVLRTFSKAMGLAGLRLGVLVARPELVAEIAKARLPFLVDRLSEAVGMAVLANQDLVAERVAVLSRERDALLAHLATLDGVETGPAAANFFLLRTPLDAPALLAALAAEGVLVRNVTGYPELAARDGRPGWVRVSVGAPEENAAFRRALDVALAGVPETT